MAEPTLCCRDGGYCDRCDLLVDLPGLRVISAEREVSGRLSVTVESAPTVMACPTCGVVAHGHGRVKVRLVDAPSFGRPVRVVWRKRAGSVRSRPVRSGRSLSRTSESRRHGRC
jgi:hypothetical protein